MNFFPKILSVHIQVETKVFLKELVNFGVMSVGSLKCMNFLLYFSPTHIHLFSTHIQAETTLDHKIQICSHYLFW